MKQNKTKQNQNLTNRGTWLVQAVEHVTLELGVVSLSPELDMEPT